MGKNKKKPGTAPIKKEVAIVNNFGVETSLGSAIFGGDNFGMGVQLSQADTMFKNNRWYLISNLRQLLSEIYVEHGIIRTIVDVPVDDAFRGGFEVSTKQIDEEDMKDLLEEMDREGDFDAFKQAKKWTRLFGGGAIIIMTDQDPIYPLDVEAIDASTPLTFRAVDMWELFFSKQNTADYAEAIAEEDWDGEFYDYYGMKVHKSRVIRMVGDKAPSFIRPRLRGWGMSVVEAFVRSLNQYLKATDLSFEVLDEYKIDVFKFKNLANYAMSKQGMNQIHNRIFLANSEKNYRHSIALDKEDDYEQKQIQLAGIAEAMASIRVQVAADLRMPLTKIFGVSSAGFNSGEDDIENYNAMIESTIRSSSKFEMVEIIKLRCQQKFQVVPDDLKVSYKPLRVLSSEQEENVKTQRFNRVLAAKQAGEIDGREFREACNKDNLLPIRLDPKKEMLKAPSDDSKDDEIETRERTSKVKPKDAKEANS